MKFTNVEELQVTKPMIIAAMQEMGNIRSIVIDFINRSLNITTNTSNTMVAVDTHRSFVIGHDYDIYLIFVSTSCNNKFISKQFKRF
jgi:hypothetical protein